jgi:ADP-ribosylation factor GTPase-activating protein 1
MDAFKQSEIARMQNGGNKKWQVFYNKNAATPFEEATIKERYDCEVGEEWKERLSAIVEDREFDKETFRKEREEILRKQKEKQRDQTPMGRVASQSQTGSRTASPAPGQAKGISAEQKAKNEEYFARMGQQNSSRPEGVAPSQGGKYAGFGSTPPEPQGGSADAGGQALPGADEFQKDPIGALTKGFGWFGAAVSKQAKMVNDSYIQPTAKNASIHYQKRRSPC